jgi:potassium efflux system protein
MRALALSSLLLVAAPLLAQEADDGQDAGVPAAGLPEAGVPVDGGMPDGGWPDAGEPDAGPSDAGPPDAGPLPEVQEDDAPPPDQIPSAEVGRRIEETFRLLQQRLPDFDRQPVYLEVRRELPRFRNQVGRLRQEPALARLDVLEPAALEELKQEWERIRQRAGLWQDRLEGRSAQLAEDRVEILEARTTWLRTRDEERLDPLPPAQTQRIDELIGRIEGILFRLDDRLESVLELQAELSDQGILIAQTTSEISAAQRNARERRLEADHYPAWAGWGRLPETPPPPGLEEVNAEQVASLSAFLRTEALRVVLNVLFLGGLLVLLALLSRRPRNRHRSKPLSPHRTLRVHPIASSVLLGLVVAPIFYPYVPVIAEDLGRLLLIPAILALGVSLLPRASRPVLAHVVLAGLSVVISLGYLSGLTERLVHTGFQVAGIAITAVLFLRRIRADILEMGPKLRFLHWLVGLSIVPQSLALYLHLLGYVRLAELWSLGTFRAIELVAGLYIGAELLQALLKEGLRRPEARVFYTVRERRYWVTRQATRLLYGAALVAYAYLVLSSYDLLDPSLDWLRGGLKEVYSFGSLEVSVGEVLAFLLMIAGTFLVMRLVHGLLENEILPRTELEEGVSSAISLSVSYLLVGIGTVLAFGVAGVDAERLALLGGALGVGIGFGLQNVVSNFVSGLILVAERPIEVGDFVQVGDLVGRVRRIGVRSSTVRSLEGAEVIVPNADLISSHLINWTLSDQRRRSSLVIGTGYQHPPREVIPILLRVVRTQPGVLLDPPPDVLCSGFGDSSIDYEVRFWAASYLEAITARSDLAVRVYDTLDQHGIEIPFPQRDVTLRKIEEQAAESLRPSPPEPEE